MEGDVSAFIVGCLLRGFIRFYVCKGKAFRLIGDVLCRKRLWAWFVRTRAGLLSLVTGRYVMVHVFFPSGYLCFRNRLQRGI